MEEKRPPSLLTSHACTHTLCLLLPKQMKTDREDALTQLRGQLVQIWDVLGATAEECVCPDGHTAADCDLTQGPHREVCGVS